MIEVHCGPYPGEVIIACYEDRIGQSVNETTSQRMQAAVIGRDYAESARTDQRHAHARVSKQRN
jgi:hypothetical protein